MPYKRGGGGWYQLYDEDNGQYTDEQKIEMFKNDQKTLGLYLKNRMVAPGNEPAFPMVSIHDKKYCQDFVKAYKDQFNKPTIEPSKAWWLFEYHKEHDRSKFLMQTIGYSNSEHDLFRKHVIKNTDFTTIKFSRIDKGKYFKCKALTKLKNGKVATTIWLLRPDDLKLTFNTIIPDRSTYDKD